MAFFVVKGYANSDHYTSNDGPVLEVVEYKTKEEVEAAHTKFMAGKDNENYSDVTFRIFEGRELKINPVEKVTKFELG